MNADKDRGIEILVREKMEGKSYAEIRMELLAKGLSEEEVGKLIRQVDEQVLIETVEQGKTDKIQQWYRIGLILAVIGLVLTIAYNAGIILNTLPALLIYSPFIAGILLMFYGRIRQKKQSPPAAEGTGAIRRKRPYK